MIRGEKAKDDETWVLPISARLAAVLKMAKGDPARTHYEPEAYVFLGTGLQVENIKRAGIPKAHGLSQAGRRRGSRLSGAALTTICLRVVSR